MTPRSAPGPRRQSATPATKPAAIRLLIADDPPMFRVGLVQLINSQPDMVVIAEAADGHEAVELYRRLRPDVVLMDLRLPGLSGVEAIIAIRKDDPGARVIVITTYDLDEDIYRAVQSGALSYLLKDMSTDQITGAIRAAHRGEQQLPAVVANRLAERLQRRELTDRELQTLQELAKGRSNKEIASSLYISEETVKSHLKTWFEKLGVRDRTEAVICAIRYGIVYLE